MATLPEPQPEANDVSGANATYAHLAPGDPAPWFYQRSTSNKNYGFDTAAGRYVVLCFFVSAAQPAARAALDAVAAHKDYFDDERCCFFGVTIDPKDESEHRVGERLPGIRYFWDQDGAISRLYGSIPTNSSTTSALRAKLFWLVLSPTLRVMAVFPIAEHEKLFGFLQRLPPPDRYVGFEIPAPVLILPQIFEPDFCRTLIDVYEAKGGQESGFMRDVDGKTVPVMDAQFKRRKDCVIDDSNLMRAIQSRVVRRINPELRKVFAFDATRMERYIVCCYSAEDGGHFRAHRDNTTKATAHRRFAVSINLNSEFEGGELSFPEYGKRGYKPPIGAAVIFPCALLHAVSPVKAGRRYAFLPFLYDEAAAKIRVANNPYLAEGVAAYKM